MFSPLRKLTIPFRNHGTTDLTSNSEEFLSSLNLIIGLDQLLDFLSSHLKEISGARTVYTVLLQQITNRYIGVKAWGDDGESLKLFTFAPSDKLISWLSVNRTPLDLQEQADVVDYLSPREQELLHQFDIALVVPCIVVNNLTGAVFLGKRQNGARYGREEVVLLTRLISQAALAIEHASLYQLQEHRLKKLFQADKLATVGELAAGAAHEIRNPLTFIRSTVQQLSKQFPDEKTKQVLQECDRINEIVGGLLSLSKSSSVKKCRLDLAHLVEQTLPLLEHEFRKHQIKLVYTISGTDSHVLGEASQLKQLLVNLLMNSVQAMPQGGTITIRLSSDSDTGGAAGRRDVISLTITDTGYGIVASDISKVFDPFFTTKEKGTGLGLSICYGIVTNHGGEIHIDSATDGSNTGTTVTVRLPRFVG